MKSQFYNIKGEKKSEIELPKVFDTSIREDIITKVAEAERLETLHPHSPSPMAGRRHSASGTISHRRHKWKGHYGRGISRVPRKTMWRRGTQFYWVGAEVSSTRGGRRVHGPSLLHSPRKINKKEAKLALNSALASTAHKEIIQRRYSSLDKKKIEFNFPVIIESRPTKAKDFITALKKIFGELFPLVLKSKEVRSGKGKLRGRKYKSNAGALIITGKDENLKMKGIDIVSLNNLSILELYPIGRLTILTEKALAELEEMKR